VSSIELCIKQLESVREAAADPTAVYVIRSRLERLLLSCARLAAELNTAAMPDMPRRVVDTSNASPGHAIAEACNALHDSTGSICRPSESLDLRWAEGWRRISAELDHLEGLLRAQPQLV
jgi:hypothetical protein